ncbi:hypothetical protein ACT0K6_000163 [Enterococcus faecalis]|uniref:hypothetical protein n=1 Tax=Enterococcus faecalis TaxID=1351 RepID=UPI000CF16704|nr:hypothetical protein [Enterococcus faecalis]MBO6372961.1 hypothetical protein [Enterococcus faecalis]MCO5486736.1 hypothetical protein [Enterococcus faecalis]MDN3096592.1 hypothetical protein [Enterococcus faecalis]PQD11477.1 hypothetical protein CUM65_04045 [Enterococcus faecalis]PQG37171.1 hypothetical protein CUS34_10810 [Enterococcus faecalis]
MNISQSDIEHILIAGEESTSLTTLMEKLSIQQTNINRLQLTSLIKWNSNIKRTYVKIGTETQTLYYLKK